MLFFVFLRIQVPPNRVNELTTVFLYRLFKSRFFASFRIISFVWASFDGGLVWKGPWVWTPKKKPIELVSTTKNAHVQKISTCTTHCILLFAFKDSSHFYKCICIYWFSSIMLNITFEQSWGGEQGHNLKQKYSPPGLNPSLIALISVSMQSVEKSAKQSVWYCMYTKILKVYSTV